MDVAITGASGLIGTALSASLRADGHRVVTVSRSASAGDTVRWDPSTGTIESGGLEGLDAVVHLAGEPIASGAWTKAQRRRIHHSRAQGTRLLATTLAGLDQKPAVLVSGSAIGAYGDRGDEVMTEASRLGQGFLADVCREWEAAAAQAGAAGIRVALARTGIVLSAEGGALAAELPIFRLGLGGRAGKGNQWMSWITLADEVAALRFVIDHDLSGPVNLTTPAPVTNATFTEALGRALHKRTLLTIPRAVRRVPFGVGDLVGSLLFASQRVEPTVLVDAGFIFVHTDIDDALQAIVAKG
ncbi:MAG: TIGR01777 family oxidoreductase [Acidimicrobiales bacterium]